MANYEVLHGGGPFGSVTVTDTPIVVRPVTETRRYLIMFGHPDNTVILWLAFLNPKQIIDGVVPVAEFGTPLVPGGFYEMNKDNLSTCAVYAIARATETGAIPWQEGA